MGKRSAVASKKATSTMKLRNAQHNVENTMDGLAPAMPAVPAVPAMPSKIISKDNGQTILLKLPAEIKQKIWTLAITIDGPITPIQLRTRSNKFFWSRSQVKEGSVSVKRIVINATVTGTGTATAPCAGSHLTAVQLSQVCRALYEEVALTHLFYKANHFMFKDPIGPIPYLIAITTPRMNAIRSIACDWPHYSKEASQLFTVLAACGGLQSLELRVHPRMFASASFEPSALPGFKEALIAVEGLYSLTLKRCEKSQECLWCHPWPSTANSKLETSESVLHISMKQARGTSMYKRSILLAVQRDVSLDIHGEGRLGEDKKPGIVASRTRQQLRNLKSLQEDGTMPKRIISKYDSNGDLTWHVDKILGARQSEVGGLSPSVEFQVKCAPLTGIHQQSEVPAEISWESVDVLDTKRYIIVRFYQQQPRAYGKEAVLDAWMLRDKDGGKEEKVVKADQSYAKQLSAIAQREAVIEQQEAARATREAAKAAKVTKKRNKARKASTH